MDKADMEYIYKTEVVWNSEKTGVLHIEDKPDLPVATPPEFGGHEGITSPEDLFVASAAVCLMSTFLAMAKKVGAEYETFRCRAEGKLEKSADAGLLFTRIDLYPQVTVRDEKHVKKVKRALELGKKYCLVTNSMKTEIAMHSEISIRRHHPTVS